jgi:hypothetical protein
MNGQVWKSVQCRCADAFVLVVQLAVLAWQQQRGSSIFATKDALQYKDISVQGNKQLHKRLQTTKMVLVSIPCSAPGFGERKISSSSQLFPAR